MKLLDIRDLHVRFAASQGEVHAVRGVSLAAQRGECLAIVGESGAGKTQTMRACLGLLDAGATVTGSVLFRGEEILGVSELQLNRVRGSHVALICQDAMSALTPHMRIGDQMVEALIEHQRVPRRHALERAMHMLDWVRLPDSRQRLAQYPHELSGGMRQRIVIAMALMTEPDLLIADEPTSALDVVLQAQMIELFQRMQRERGMTLILISHDFSLVAALADRVAVMQAGQVVEQGESRQVLAEPRHEHTRKLWRSTRILAGMDLSWESAGESAGKRAGESP